MSTLATHNPKNAVELIRKLEPVLAAKGYHLALTGSVLFKGGSEHDTDLIAYPHKERLMGNSDVLALLIPHGIEPWPNKNDYLDYPGRQIARCNYQGRRIDIFFL